MREEMRPEAELVDLLRSREWTVTTVESCTGGGISARIVDIPGASDVLRMAFVTYCDEAKTALAGVSPETLRKHTAVSAETAEEMAREARLVQMLISACRRPALQDPEEPKSSRPAWYILAVSLRWRSV